MSLKLATINAEIVLPNVTLSDNYTIETWLKILTNEPTTLLKIGTLPGVYNTLEYNAGSPGNIEIFWMDTSEGDTSVLTGIWYHIAIVKQGTSVKFYLSGQRFGNIVTDIGTDSLPISFSTPLPTPNLLYYNIQFTNAVKYTANFVPSADLPFNISSYVAIVHVAQSIIVGGQISSTIEILGSGPVSLSGITVNEDIPAGAPSIKSTICFVAGTPVLTDNFGYVPIDELNSDVHTIGGKNILVVTRTVTPEKHLIVIKEGLLAPGVPSADTICTANHKIKINAEMVKSYEIPGACIINYHGQSLYNVALKGDDSREMIVNNMTVETLDPENLITKVHLALKDSTPEQRTEILTALSCYTHKLLGAVV
jgi:hypothetical protein